MAEAAESRVEVTVRPTPTVVIGVGEAGRNAVLALYDLVREEGRGEYFEFVVIDSNAEDLKQVPRELSTMLLKYPPTDRALREDFERFKYLAPYREEVERRAGLLRGVMRQRVLARYLVDLGYQELYDYLYRKIHDFVRKHQARAAETGLNLWLIHSLGGGTGSGSFPVLARMLASFKEKLKKELGIGSVFMGGVGFLPTAPEDPAAPMHGDPAYYANALAALLEIDKMRREALKIPLYHPIHSGRSPMELEVKEFPLDKYFLVGINEEEVTRAVGAADHMESYVREKNFSVANCLLALHNFSGLENWPITDVERRLVIGSLAEHEVRVPVELLREYIRAKSRLEKLKELKERFVQGSLPEQVERDVGVTVDNLFMDGMEKVTESKIERTVEDIWERKGVEAARLCLDKIDERLEREEDEYKKRLRMKISEISRKVDVKGGDYDLQTRYKEVRGRLEERISKLEETLRSPSLISRLPLVPWSRRREEERSDLEKSLRGLESTRGMYERVVRLRGKVVELRGKVEDEIRSRLREEVQRALRREVEAGTSLKELGRMLDDAMETIRGDLEVLSRELSEARTGRVYLLPLRKEGVERITEAELERLDSIKAFVERGYIDKNDVMQAINVQVENAQRFSRIGVRDAERDDLIILCSPKNKELLEGVRGHRTVELHDGHVIKICYYQVGLEVEDIHDFIILKERYEEGKLQELLRDRRVEESFAYPEWFLENKGVRAIYEGMGIGEGE